MSVVHKLRKLGIALESCDLHQLSEKIPALIREINAAPSKDAGVEISDWTSFLDWWNNNWGQGLEFVFIDTFGEDSEEVNHVKKLIEDEANHERELHEFYMFLRRKAQQQQQASQQQAQQALVPQKEEEEPTLKVEKEAPKEEEVIEEIDEDK